MGKRVKGGRDRQGSSSSGGGSGGGSSQQGGRGGGLTAGGVCVHWTRGELCTRPTCQEGAHYGPRRILVVEGVHAPIFGAGLCYPLSDSPVAQEATLVYTDGSGKALFLATLGTQPKTLASHVGLLQGGFTPCGALNPRLTAVHMYPSPSGMHIFYAASMSLPAGRHPECPSGTLVPVGLLGVTLLQGGTVVQDTFPVCATDEARGHRLAYAHPDAILAIDSFEVAGSEEPVLVTGDASGRLCVWDRSPGTGEWGVMVVEDPMHGHVRAIRSIVAFRSEIPGHETADTYFFTGGDDGRVKVWGHEASPDAYHFVQDLDEDPRPAFTLRSEVDPIVSLHCTELMKASGEEFDVLLCCHASGFLQVYDLDPMHHLTEGHLTFQALRKDTSTVPALSPVTCMNYMKVQNDQNLLVFMGHKDATISVHLLSFPYMPPVAGGNPFQPLIKLNVDTSTHRGEITVSGQLGGAGVQRAQALLPASTLTARARTHPH